MSKCSVKKSKEYVGKYRNFASILYPESMSSDWYTILEDSCVPAFLSPLHDKDINEDGTSKKAHYHIMFRFDVPQTLQSVQKLCDSLGAINCKHITSPRGYARYLLHLDNPEKHQYSRDLIVSFGGADYDDTISLSSDKYKAIAEIIDYCKFNEITSYAVLLDYSRINKPDWFRVLCDSGTYVVKEYLKSFY